MNYTRQQIEQAVRDAYTGKYFDSSITSLVSDIFAHLPKRYVVGCDCHAEPPYRVYDTKPSKALCAAFMDRLDAEKCADAWNEETK